MCSLGLYVCVLFHSMHIHLFTGNPPDIPPPRIPVDNQTVDIGFEQICITNGSSVTFYCNSPVGSLPISYFWLAEGNTLSDPLSTGQFLTVSEAGMYTCVAVNAFGQDNATSTVISKHARCKIMALSVRKLSTFASLTVPTMVLHV